MAYADNDIFYSDDNREYSVIYKMIEVSILSKYISNFLLILLRASIFISMLPFFGSKNFPAQFKIGLVVALAALLTPIVELKVKETYIPILVIREVILGIALGFIARFVFFAVEVAAQLISTTMGLGMASVFNPEFGQSTEIARLYGIIAILTFLAMDAHHDLIHVFVKSYAWIPQGEIGLRYIVTEVISTVVNMSAFALKLSAPVLIMMLITNLILGFVYRATPQINVFFVSSPVFILVGFLVMLFGISVFIYVSGSYFNNIKNDMFKLMNMVRD
jgi:flagellar biosynthetic protein FliR